MISSINHVALWNELEKLNFNELCLWLAQNFTPERYRDGNKDVVKGACSLLYNRETTYSSEMITEFYSLLWGAHAELPDYLPNIDHYGRLSTWRPNYDKPGMKERIQQEVDATFDVWNSRK